MVHTILLIDSDLAQREVVCSMLKDKLSYHIISVATGKDAMNYVMTDHQPKPDLVLFDVSKITGVCETIANLKILIAQTPIITLVQYGDYETAIDTLNAGAQDFLLKPVALERMNAILRNTLSLRDARREAEWLRQARMNEAGNMRGISGHNSLQQFSLIAEDGNIRRMAQLEAEAIRFAMEYYNGRMTEVARRLGIGRSTLYRKLSDMGVRPAEAAA
jgi:DNA-binding NtrC family response regulator